MLHPSEPFSAFHRRRRGLWCIVAAVACLSAVACTTSSPAARATPETCAPSSSTDGPTFRKEDLAHFIYHRGFFYYAHFPQGSISPVFGEPVGSITCTLIGTPDSDPTPSQGLSGYVAAGTRFFKLRACPESVAIAATFERRPLVFVRSDIAMDMDGEGVVKNVSSACTAAVRQVESPDP